MNKPAKRNTQLSKSLSWLLRHGLVKENIPVREDGFVLLNDVLRHPKFQRYTLEQIQDVVQSCEKQRFSLQQLEDGVWIIRANQGHSKGVAANLKSDKLLDRIHSSNQIPICVHGTYSKNVESILKNGLSRMNREHIHFATGLPKDDGVISGMRVSTDVLIYLNVEKAMADNIPLFMSANKVILSPGIDGRIPVEYFSKVVNRKTGEVLLHVEA